MRTKKVIPYPLPPSQLETECLAIFGERWKFVLSEKLNVTHRAVNLWVTGQRKIPGAVVFALNVLKGVR